MSEKRKLPRILPIEIMNEIIENQLGEWVDARQRFHDLGKTERRIVQLGDMRMALQLNPARIRSTGAKVDAASIAKRPCFLCAANRPAEQHVYSLGEEWDLLVNPFPIFPTHFTIVNTGHQPQGQIPFDIIEIAERMPGMAIFYNGASAGASAPDHLHLQGVLASELPLLRITEKLHPSSEPGIKRSGEFGGKFPFEWVSAVITPDMSGVHDIYRMTRICGLNPETGKPDTGLVNAFAWLDSSSGLMRMIVIPRRAHRPSRYFDEKNPIVVSPGAIDMAGVMITPRSEDFHNLSDAEIEQIYAETAYTRLPDEIFSHAEIQKDNV